MDCQLSHSLKVNNVPDEEYFKTNKLNGDWYMSEKYDGIRAIWDGSNLTTRSKRKFTWVPQWFLDALPKDESLDGEIFVPGQSFGYFSSLSIQKENPIAHQKWKEVIFLIFDYPYAGIEFSERLKHLKYIKLPKFVKIVKFIKLDLPKDFQKVNEQFISITQKNGEGVMLIKANSEYSHGKRSRNSLKYKKEHISEAKVVDISVGAGKYIGVLGKLKCQLENGNTFFCGTGFNDLQRNCYHFDINGKFIKMSNETEVPKIGDIISYSCMEIIEKTGIPRMSVYRGIRPEGS
jgi:DNA ligase-1